VGIPIRFLPTQEIAPETFLIRQIAGEGTGPFAVGLNSMVIRGEEPVILDTGAGLTRAAWLEQAYALVDPEDIKYIFISHDDPDHVGALQMLFDDAPNATLVTNFFSLERLGLEQDVEIPMSRVRFVNPGESFVAGDRTLTAHVPPIFDGPTTRGLFDHKTGAFWGVDSFVALYEEAVDSASEMSDEWFTNSFLDVNRLISPWHQWLDTAKYRSHLGMLRALDPTVIANAHGPVVEGERIEQGFALTAQLPDMEPVPLLGQSDLDAMLAAMEAEAQEQAA